MKVVIKQVNSPKEEQVILECMKMTKDFEEIRQYVLTKGEMVSVYQNEKVWTQIKKGDILYVEAVGEFVFAYTNQDVYQIKSRLYEVEEQFCDNFFIRCSKSVLLNLNKVISVRPALNGRFLAKMENGEEVMISRQFAKAVKKSIMEEL